MFTLEAQVAGEEVFELKNIGGRGPLEFVFRGDNGGARRVSLNGRAGLSADVSIRFYRATVANGLENGDAVVDGNVLIINLADEKPVASPANWSNVDGGGWWYGGRDQVKLDRLSVEEEVTFAGIKMRRVVSE